MSEENDRPLAQWSTTHIIAFLGLSFGALGGWVTLNREAAETRAMVDRNIQEGAAYRVESSKRLERIEDNQMKLMMAFGVKPLEE